MHPCLPATVAAALMSGGCTVTIRPPLAPIDPVELFIIDYGRHSSLLIPDPDGSGLIEFAYGDWNWFALAKDGPLDVLPTLFFHTQGALGRWEWNVAPDLDHMEFFGW